MYFLNAFHCSFSSIPFWVSLSVCNVIINAIIAFTRNANASGIYSANVKNVKNANMIDTV